MVTVAFDDLENAVLIVDGAAVSAQAWVCRATGTVHVRSDSFDQECDPLPDNIDDADRFIPVPGARSLDLGHALVFGFALAEMPQAYEQVRQMFRRPGAYGRFGKLVDDLGLRERWHAFRDEQTRAALCAWCKENGLRLANDRGA